MSSSKCFFRTKKVKLIQSTRASPGQRILIFQSIKQHRGSCNHHVNPQIRSSRRLTRIIHIAPTRRRLSHLLVHAPVQPRRPRIRQLTIQENPPNGHRSLFASDLHPARGGRHDPRPHNAHEPATSPTRHSRPGPQRRTRPARALSGADPPARHPRHGNRQGQDEREFPCRGYCQGRGDIAG